MHTSWSRFWTVNHWASASNYQLSNINPFKNAIVMLLIKKTSLSKDLKSYLPISGLGFLSKLIEHVVAVQIRSHINSNDLGMGRGQSDNTFASHL